MSSAPPRRSIVRAALAFALSATFAALALPAVTSAAPAPATSDGSPTWTTNGTVNAVAVSGSTAYVGGRFDRIGPYTGASAAFDVVSGERRSAWPDVAGQIQAVEPDGSGGWYLGGYFTAVGDVPASSLVHVRADGSVDPAFTASLDGGVNDILAFDGHLYVGGQFKNNDGVPQRGLAVIDAGTGRRVAELEGVTGDVYALALGGSVSEPILYVGGTFGAAGGLFRSNVAAYSLTTSLPTAFTPDVNGPVRALDVTADGVYLGGGFTKLDGLTRNGVGRVNGATGAPSGWDPKINVSGGIYAIAATATGEVYVGGAFGSVNIGLPTEVGRTGVAAFSASTAVVTSWAPVLKAGGGGAGTVVDIDARGGDVQLAGLFGTVQGNPRAGAAIVTAADASLQPWDPRLDVDQAMTIARGGDTIVVGGTFESAGTVKRTTLAAIDLRTGQPTAFDARLEGTVNTLAVSPDGVWAAGDFSRISGVTSDTDIAKFDPVTGERGDFAQQTDGAVRALVVVGGDVYAGGTFTNIGTTPRANAAAFRELPGTSGALLPWAPNANGPVNALARSADGRVYLGGEFTTLKNGTAPRRYLGAVDSTGAGTPTAWNPEANGKVRSLAFAGQDVVAGGEFTLVNGNSGAHGVAVLDPTSGVAKPFDVGFDAPVAAVASDGETIYAGGAFTHAGVQERSRAAAFTTGGELLPWAPALRETTDPTVVRSIAVTGEWLVVGGRFRIERGAARGSQIAAYKLPAPPAPADRGGSGGPGGAGGPGGGANGPGGGSRGPGGDNAVDRRAPLISRVGVTRKRFRVGRPPRRGTGFSLTLDEPGRVTFEVRGRRGRKVVKRGSFTKSVKAGRSTVKWDGKVARRSLRPGAYTVRVVARDAAGNASRARTVRVRVIR